MAWSICDPSQPATSTANPQFGVPIMVPERSTTVPRSAVTALRRSDTRVRGIGEARAPPLPALSPAAVPPIPPLRLVRSFYRSLKGYGLSRNCTGRQALLSALSILLTIEPMSWPITW